MSEKTFEGKEQTDENLYEIPVFTGLKDSCLPAQFEGLIENPADRFLDLKWGEKKTTFNNVYEAYDTAIESDSRLAGALENASESIFSLKSGVEPLGKDATSKAVADWVKAYLDFMDDETGDGFQGVLENIYKSIEYSISMSAWVRPEDWIEFNGLKVPPLIESRPGWLFQYNLLPPCDAELRKRLATGSTVGEPCEPNTILAHSYKAQMPGRPYGRGLMFDLFPLAHIKIHLMAWAARFTEKYGMPIEKISYIPSATKVVANMLKKQGANRYCTVEIPLDENMKPMQMDPIMVEFIETKANQVFVYGDFIKLIEEEYAFRALGSTLTSGTADQGTRALGDVHMEVSNKLMAGRARYVERCLYKILKMIFTVNRAKVLPAKWKLYTEQVTLTPEKASVAVQLGLPLITQEVYDGIGFTMPTEEDEVTLPVKPAAPAYNPFMASKGALTASKDSPIQRKSINPGKREAQLKLQAILVKATREYIDTTLFKAWQKMAASLNVPADPASAAEKVIAQQLDSTALVDAAYTVFLNRFCLGYLLSGRATATSEAVTASKELDIQKDTILDAAAVLALYRAAIPMNDDEWNAVDQALRDKAIGFVDSRGNGLKAKIAALATRALGETPPWDKKRFIDEARKIIDAQRNPDYSLGAIGLGILWLGRQSQSMGEKAFAQGAAGQKKGKPGFVRSVFGYEWISDLSIPWEDHHPGHGEANGYIGSLEAYEQNGDPEPGMVPNCLCDWRDVSWEEAVDIGAADWDGNIINHEPNGPFPADFEMGLL